MCLAAVLLGGCSVANLLPMSSSELMQQNDAAVEMRLELYN